MDQSSLTSPTSVTAERGQTREAAGEPTVEKCDRKERGGRKGRKKVEPSIRRFQRMSIPFLCSAPFAFFAMALHSSRAGGAVDGGAPGLELRPGALVDAVDFLALVPQGEGEIRPEAPDQGDGSDRQREAPPSWGRIQDRQQSGDG